MLIALHTDLWEYSDIIAMRILLKNGFDEGKRIINSKKRGLSEYMEEFESLEESIKP